MGQSAPSSKGDGKHSYRNILSRLKPKREVGKLTTANITKLEVEPAVGEPDDVQEETLDIEDEEDSSSFASGGSAWSSASSAASATFKAVGRIARKGFDGGFKKVRSGRSNKFDEGKKWLDSVLPLFPHHSPDPGLSKVYDDLCTFIRLSGLHLLSKILTLTARLEMMTCKPPGCIEYLSLKSKLEKRVTF
jgi:hypothetical protein